MKTKKTQSENKLSKQTLSFDGSQNDYEIGELW
jgi:hypothetical protein